MKLLLTTIALLLLATSPALAAETEYYGPANAKTAVVVIHGGGFIFGSNEMTRDTSLLLADNGYRAINLSYPLGDLTGAEQALRQEIKKAGKRHQRIYSYGESAGGGLAALAAARGWVDGGYAWAPVSDLTAWHALTEAEAASLGQPSMWTHFRDVSPETLRRVSAVRYASNKSAPFLIVHGSNDKMVPFNYSERLAKKWPRLKLIKDSGGHTINDPASLRSGETALQCFKYRQDCRWAR